MMSGVLIYAFGRLLAASVIGGGLALLLLALRRPLARLGSRFWYYCWLAPLVILLAAPLVPLKAAEPMDSIWLETEGGPSGYFAGNEQWPESDINADINNETINDTINDTVGIVGSMAGSLGGPVGEGPAASMISLKDMADKINIGSWLGHLAVIWLAGACAGLIGWGLAYGLLLRRIGRHSRGVEAGELGLDDCELAARLAQLTLRREDGSLGGPFLAGLLRPCLIVPGGEAAAGLSEADWRNLLRHELVHFERRDLWYKWLGLLACGLHWFNPVVWRLRRVLGEYCEISCDLAVCGGLDAEERRGYMRTILLLLRPRPQIMTTGMGDSKGLLRRRFEMIDKGNSVRSSLVVIAGAVLLVLALAGCAGAANVGKDLGDAGGADGAPKVVGQVTVRRGDEVLELENMPFVEVDVAYLPLREVLEKFEILGPEDTGLDWQNGRFVMELRQPLTDAAGGTVMESFYIREFTADDVCGRVKDGVLYVPADFFLELELYARADGGDALAGFNMVWFSEDGTLAGMCSKPELMRDTDSPWALREFAASWEEADWKTLRANCTDKLRQEFDKGTVAVPAIAAVAVSRYDLSSAELLVLGYPTDGRSNYDLVRYWVRFEDNLIGGIRNMLEIEAIGNETDNNKPIIGGADGPTAVWLAGKLEGPVDMLAEGSGELKLIQPVIKGKIANGFSERHLGMDFAAEAGEPVMAAAAGRVLAAGYMGADGNKILLEHSGGLETRYSHLSKIAVEAGQTVSAGEVIGYVGSTGNSTGPHLHFVILLNGEAVDPAIFWPVENDVALDMVAGAEKVAAWQQVDRKYTVWNKAAAVNVNDRDAWEYYQEKDIVHFKTAFCRLDQREQEELLEWIYGNGDAAFFAAGISWLAYDDPIVERLAAKAYADREMGFLSIAADRLGRERLAAWAEQAAAEGNIAARSVLMSKLEENDEFEREQEEKNAELAARQEAEYAAFGISAENTALNEYYYNGRLVRVLLDPRRGGDFYVLNVNPKGEVDIKVERDAEDKISGVRYLTESEVRELLGDMQDPE